jgi:Ca-activated chloride channel family protein
VIRAFEVLLEELNASDTISIVVYAGSEGLALPPTRCDTAGRARVSSALGRLSAGGSTNGGAGIKLAYELARENFKPGGINRVILATDGDFNVGVTGDGGLVRLVEQNAKSNVFLTVLGFGTGNLNDSMMEAITNKGNGTYHYIDSYQEARHVFLDKLMGTLVMIAKDVKIQVEFNPAQVKRYRLLGYANRMLRSQDFSDDKIDAGDIGSGHTVTAFYEVETSDGNYSPAPESLRYQKTEPTEKPSTTVSDEWLTVKLRYKQPDGDKSTLIERPFMARPRAFDQADADFRFGTSVAMAGLLLRETEGMGKSGFKDVVRIARSALGADSKGQRAEFLALIERLAARE